MIEKVLTTFDSKEEYAIRVGRVVEEIAPLTFEKALEMCKKAEPVVCQVVKGCLDYDALVAIEKLDSVKLDRTGARVIASHLNKNYSLSVGIKPTRVHIVQEYFSNDLGDHPLQTKSSYWIKVPRGFLTETHKILPSVYMKRKFKSMIE